MGAQDLIRGARVVAVQGDGTANTNTVLFTAELATKVDEIPSGWDDGITPVRIKANVSKLHYIFSSDNTQTVDSALAASDAGTRGADLGGTVEIGNEVSVVIERGFKYFAREADAASSTVLMVRG